MYNSLRSPRQIGAVSAVALVSALALAGCAADATAGNSGSGSGSAIAVGYSPKFLKDDFQVLLLAKVKENAKAQGFDLIGAPDANGDVAKQVSDLQNMMANGAKALVIVPVDGSGVVPAIQQANAKNIPVFSLDDAPKGGKVAATVRADNVNAGAQGAEEMVKRLKTNSCWPSNCSVLELQGGLDTPNGLDRSQGFAGKLKELAPEVKIIQRPTEWTAEKAADATQNVLTQTPNLNGIFMASELMASAVNAQLKSANHGAKVGESGAVIRVAIDGTPNGLQLIRDKELDATVSQPLSAYAKTVMSLIAKVNAGEKITAGKQADGQIVDTPVGPQYQLNATLVTSDNVDDKSLWGNQAG